LHGYREIVDGLRWEEDIDGFLLEDWSTFFVIYFNNVELTDITD
jgi:hypothetical protein